ncbi:MAG TPA: hypothetical protein VIN59_02330 [Alphaproteobacteria bacterium]
MAGDQIEAEDQVAQDTVSAHKKFVKDLKNAVDFARDPARRGTQAYLALTQLQVIINEGGQNIWEDYSYKLAGFTGRAQFETHARREAMHAAIENFRLAEHDKGVIATIDTIDMHSYYGMELAWDMILSTGKPLFADDTYKPLGLTRDAFMAHMRESHIDCAAQKARIALEEVMNGTLTDAGHALVKSIRDKHFAALGIDSIDDAVATSLQFTAETLDVIESAYARRQVQNHLRIADAAKKDGDIVAYAMNLAEAWDLVNNDEDLRQSPETFKDTKYNAVALLDACARATETVLRHYLELVKGKGNNFQSYTDLIQNLNRLREVLHYDVEPNLVDPRADYWFQDVFHEYQCASLAHFLADAHATRGVAVANVALLSAKGAHASNLEKMLDYNRMNTAIQHFGKAYIMLDDTQRLAELGLDANAIHNLMAQTAASIANDHWDKSFLVGADNQEVLDLFPDLYDATAHLRGTDEEAHLDFTRKEAFARERLLLVRGAEQALAKTLICLPDQFGVHPLLEEAFDYLDQAETDINNEKFLKKSGLTAAMAQGFDLKKDVISMVQQWRDALDEDYGKISARFARMTDVTLRLAHFEEDGNQDAITMFLHYADAQDMDDVHERHVGLAREMVIDTLDQLSDDDLDLAYQYERAEDLLNAVSVINPEDPDNKFVFKRITGLDFDAFHQKFEKLKVKSDNTITRVRITFDAVARSKDVLQRAMDPKNAGEVAYDLIDGLAYQLRRDGSSILDPNVLAQVGLRPQELKTILYGHAIQAARACIARAQDKDGYVVTLKNWREHPFGELQGAFMWVMRMPHFSLEDAPYQAIGFLSRHDFQDTMRDALLDLTAQLEQAALHEGAGRGAREYLKALDEVRAGYRALGLEDKEDILRMSTFNKVEGGRITIDTTQRAIKGMGKAAINNVMRDAWKNAPIDSKDPDDCKDSEDPANANVKFGNPKSYRYKGLMGIMDFARNMQTMDWALADPNQEIVFMLDSVVRGRVERALAWYMKSPGEPSRAIRLATALERLNQSHNLEATSWFNDLFEQYEFTDYRAFVEMAAITRVTQIIKRTNEMLSTIKPEDAGKDQGLHLTIARDLRRIGSSVKMGFMTEAQKQGLLDNLGVNPDWVDTTMALNAQLALPLLISQVQDPTLHDQKRLHLLQEIEFFVDKIGPEGVKHAKIKPQNLANLKDHTYARMASHQIFDDLFRGTPECVREGTVQAHETLSLIIDGALPEHPTQAKESRLKDYNLLRTLGLSDREADAYGMLGDYIFPYQCLSHLELFQPEQINSIYSLLFSLYDHGRHKKIDYRTPETLKKLGVPQWEEFRERVDERILEVLGHFSQTMVQPVQDLSMLRNEWNYVTQLMDVSRIQSTATPEQWQEHQLLTRAQFNDVMLSAYMSIVPHDGRIGILSNTCEIGTRPAFRLKPANLA